MRFPPSDTHFHPRDWDSYQLEAYATAVSKTKQRRTAIDCGAHVGIMSHRMANDFETVHSFEPIWCEYLKDNLREYSNVTIHEYALGHTADAIKFAVDPHNTGATHADPNGTRLVQQYALDDWQFERVDFIKMDLEGWEYYALIGAEQTIRKNRPTLMIELHKRNPRLDLILETLDSWGYERRAQIRKDWIWLHSS